MRRASVTFDRNRNSESRLANLEGRIDDDTRRIDRCSSRFFFGKWIGLHVEFEFQLFIAGKKFPRTKFMTLWQAKIENNDFADKFYKKLDTNMASKMSYWTVADQKLKDRVIDRLFTAYRVAYLSNGEGTAACVAELKKILSNENLPIKYRPEKTNE